MPTPPTPPRVPVQRRSLTLQSLERTSLRDQALAVVRTRILTGALAPGALCSAAALALELGVSNSPVREAMLALVDQGLLEVVRNRGFRVVRLDAEDLAEIYRLRVLLEVPAVGRLAASGTLLPAHLADLAAATVLHASHGDIAEYLQADRDFHLGMLQLLGNRRLVAVVAELRDRTRLVNVQGLAAAGLLPASAAEHAQILDAVEAGDPRTARSAMQRHLDHIPGDWNR